MYKNKLAKILTKICLVKINNNYKGFINDKNHKNYPFIYRQFRFPTKKKNRCAKISHFSLKKTFRENFAIFRISHFEKK